MPAPTTPERGAATSKTIRLVRIQAVTARGVAAVLTKKKEAALHKGVVDASPDRCYGHQAISFTRSPRARTRAQRAALSTGGCVLDSYPYAPGNWTSCLTCSRSIAGAGSAARPWLARVVNGIVRSNANHLPRAV